MAVLSRLRAARKSPPSSFACASTSGVADDTVGVAGVEASGSTAAIGLVVAPPAVGVTVGAGVAVGITVVVFGRAVGVCVISPEGLGASTFGVSVGLATVGVAVAMVGAGVTMALGGGGGVCTSTCATAGAAFVLVRLCNQKTNPSAMVIDRIPINARLTRRRVRLMARTSVSSKGCG